MNAQGVRDYLAWRTRIAIAQRMDAVGAEADFLMERDPVLTEAVRLLGESTTQADLFQAARDDVAQRGFQTGEEAAMARKPEGSQAGNQPGGCGAASRRVP
jgi:hypothetical protein